MPSQFANGHWYDYQGNGTVLVDGKPVDTTAPSTGGASGSFASSGGASGSFGDPQNPARGPSPNNPGFDEFGAPIGPSNAAGDPYDPSKSLSGVIGGDVSGMGGASQGTMDNSSAAMTDPQYALLGSSNLGQQTNPGMQGSGVPNSYGLSSVPYQSSGSSGGGSSGGGMVPNYAPSSGGIWGPAPSSGGGGGSGINLSPASNTVQRSATSNTGSPNPTYNSDPGLGQTSQIPGGSNITVAGAIPSVNNIGTPYLGGPPGLAGGPPAATPSNGPMPSDLYNNYSAFLKNPSSATDNPMYKSMLDQGLQAAQRGMAAKGFSGSGNMLTELQDRGMGIAAQYLPQMGNLYQGGAQTEANRWGLQNQGNIQAGQLGLNTWQAGSNDQLNRASAQYGMGQDQAAQIRAMQTQQQLQPVMQAALLRGY